MFLTRPDLSLNFLSARPPRRAPASITGAVAPPRPPTVKAVNVTVVAPAAAETAFAPTVQVPSKDGVQPVVPSGVKVPPGTATKVDSAGAPAAANHRFKPKP